MIFLLKAHSHDAISEFEGSCVQPVESCDTVENSHGNHCLVGQNPGNLGLVFQGKSRKKFRIMLHNEYHQKNASQ